MFQIPGIEVGDQRGPISALEFCPANMGLAIGNECGLVRNFAHHFLFFFLLDLWNSIAYVNTSPFCNHVGLHL